MPDESSLAGYLFVGLTAAAILFHLALVAGAPWGKLAWGGKHEGRLPTPMRIGSFASALLLLAFGILVLIRAGIVFPDWQPISRTFVWIVVVYCAVGVIANALSPSRWERIMWVPVTVLLLASSLTVAMGR